MVKGEKRNYQEIAISQCAKTHRNGGKREKKRSLTTFMCKKTHGMEEREKKAFSNYLYVQKNARNGGKIEEFNEKQ